ncbi:MAG: hypothetical protein EPN91_08310 [Salinibacterium sp.]|nr:MAG: hypothetical protein EPN91_08310 [Salinibacterium sp.]
MSLFLRSYESSMAKHTDAPEVFHPACAYAAFGALLTRRKYRCVLAGGVPPRWTNTWVLLVGDSGDSRKTTAISMSHEVMRRVDDTIDAPTDGSPEGLLGWLSKRHQQEENNASGIIVAGEFALMLTQYERSYSISMKPLLMELFDVPAVKKRALAKSEFTIPQPRISMLGGVAIELLPTMSTAEDWLGGFFSRCMLIHGVRTKEMKRGSTPTEAEYLKHADALHGCMRRWRNNQLKLKRPLFDYDNAALKVVDKLPRPPEEPNLKMSLARASVHLHKLSAIEQIDENPEAKAIGKKATRRALDYLMEAWWKKVPEVIDECFARGRGDFEGDRLAKRIHRYVIRHDGKCSWSEVMRGCALKSDEVRKSINSLEDAKMVKLGEGTDGEVTVSALSGDGECK